MRRGLPRPGMLRLPITSLSVTSGLPRCIQPSLTHGASWG